MPSTGGYGRALAYIGIMLGVAGVGLVVTERFIANRPVDRGKSDD